MKLLKSKLVLGQHTIPMTSALTGFQVTRRTTQGRARRGLLQVNGVQMETPALFPVLNLLTGPPPLTRNGATHKFLKRQLIFEDRRPGLMTEVLHFTDYPFRVRTFREWFPHTNGGTAKTLEHWVEEDFTALGKRSLTYKPLFFLDSGGFRLLFNREVDISEFGYTATPESILKLQLDYGADIVASLDYPIPPMLHPDEATTRIAGSTANAVRLMQLLYQEDHRTLTGKRPFPILAVHGQTPEQIRTSVLNLLQALVEAEVAHESFGIGIGSLVPLRVTHAADRIVLIVRTLVETLYGTDIPPGIDPDRIPIHAFGITGDLIPVLTYLGVDTFDSSSYIKSASVLDYYDPTTWTSQSFRKLKRLACPCAACQGITEPDLARLQEVLSGERINGKQERLGLPIGSFTVDIKSDVYGIIAYHNLNLQDREISRVRTAIEADEMATHLVQFCQVHERAQTLVEFVAGVEPSVAEALNRVQIELIPRTMIEIEQSYNAISLANDPAAFDITTRPDYHPPTDKDRLLLMACSQAKPYRTSKVHSSIFQFLERHIGEAGGRCHKVTLSGLYGPVPRECEDEAAILSYEYVLSARARQQHQLLVARLVRYLEAHHAAYHHVVAYVNAVAYRQVVVEAFQHFQASRQAQGQRDLPRLTILPSHSHGTGTKELLRHANLQEMGLALYPDGGFEMDVQPPLPHL